MHKLKERTKDFLITQGYTYVDLDKLLCGEYQYIAGSYNKDPLCIQGNLQGFDIKSRYADGIHIIPVTTCSCYRFEYLISSYSLSQERREAFTRYLTEIQHTLGEADMISVIVQPKQTVIPHLVLVLEEIKHVY